MEIVQASSANVNEVAPLFSLYREFYGMNRNPSAEIQFLKDRIENNESVLFFVREASRAIGFVQLYPSFSSASLKKIFILNDLYVLESDRSRGVAQLLISTAINYCKGERSGRISLSTAKDNPARHLYQKIGFKESSFKFYNYHL